MVHTRSSSKGPPQTPKAGDFPSPSPLTRSAKTPAVANSDSMYELYVPKLIDFTKEGLDNEDTGKWSGARFPLSYTDKKLESPAPRSAQRTPRRTPRRTSSAIAGSSTKRFPLFLQSRHPETEKDQDEAGPSTVVVQTSVEQHETDDDENEEVKNQKEEEKEEETEEEEQPAVQQQTSRTVIGRPSNLVRSFDDHPSPMSEEVIPPTPVKIKVSRYNQKVAACVPQRTHVGQYRKTMPYTSVAPKTAKRLTVPKNFKFQQRDSGVRQDQNYLAPKSPGIKKRAAVKRNPQDLTVPKPFRFHATTRANAFAEIAQNATAKSPFVPLAVRLQRFESAMPDRFKARPQQPKLAEKPALLEVTYPKSPKLLTKYRSKPTTSALSTEEREMQDIEKAGHFKAHPVNRKIFESAGDLGVPRIKKPELTIPHSPAIHKPKPTPPPPPSPPRIIRANPIRLPEEPFQPKIEHRIIKPKDFHLPGDEAAARRKKEMEEKLKREREEEERKRNFKAQPKPKQQMAPLPPARTFPLTQPEPFTFVTDARGEQYQASFREKLQMWQQIEKENKRFRAQPIPAFTEKAFQPNKSTKPLTQTDNVQLYTAVRAAERRVLDDQKKEREAIDEKVKEKKRKEDMEREKQDIRQYRRKLVHKAQPVKQYSSVQIQPSDKQLTEPISPYIGTKRWGMKPPKSTVAPEALSFGSSSSSTSGFNTPSVLSRTVVQQESVKWSGSSLR
ncbi:hypothetical protein BC938DRAFT_471081 [Jimgerdemannia flammicorona]|uniref:TPX2 C-terminal domain-containing protein n=1 Tax=Jimgerdemannia flammicorona TaxID=994334 RepID=A0A433Q8X1_9FUNG|nr:hypothetical protein BC938DRAFT_471081 [Jimgerdemannia flammicorona]